MPNHCYNQLIFRGEQSIIDKVLEEIKATKADERGLFAVIDFNRILPMPTEFEGIFTGYAMIDGKGANAWREVKLEDGTIKSIAIDDSILADWQEKYGANNWYDWRLKYWGTKWNADEPAIVYDYDGYCELQFVTAWNPPGGIFNKLKEKYSDLEIELNYRLEEDSEFPRSL